MNIDLTYEVLQEALNSGVREFIVCAGSRNSSFVEALRLEKQVKTYYWPEERSAAFFALGRSRQTLRPTAVITTSGTAAAELLPACMEAHYTSVPLLLITADRPASFRLSGAPQSVEQVGLFGPYAPYAQDISQKGECDLSSWSQRGPAHLNVCLDEPQKQPEFIPRPLIFNSTFAEKPALPDRDGIDKLHHFFKEAEHPLVIVSTLDKSLHESVIQFLLRLELPIMLEGVSGLREEPRLQHLRIYRTEKVLEKAKQAGYPIDAILRIGGIPTHRIWRDVENGNGQIAVCSISANPFSGHSWNRNVIQVSRQLFDEFVPQKSFSTHFDYWLEDEMCFRDQLDLLFQEEPLAEPSLLHALSKNISDGAHVYLGNSLPIREWDLTADNRERRLHITASRGVQGIDGQLSTFLGLCRPNGENWAILGDLTMLYDMAGFWILPQLPPTNIQVVVVNNGGGQIFARMYPYQEMINAHALNFEPLAAMWGLDYDRWDNDEPLSKCTKNRLIEAIPDNAATNRFWQKLSNFKILANSQKSGSGL